MSDIIKIFLYIITLRWLFNGGCKLLFTILILAICTILYLAGAF